MMRLLPTVVRMGWCGPTGPRFRVASSAYAGRPAAQRATKALAAASPKRPVRVSIDIVSLLPTSAQVILSLMESLAHRGKTRCGFCHNKSGDFSHTAKWRRPQFAASTPQLRNSTLASAALGVEGDAADRAIERTINQGAARDWRTFADTPSLKCPQMECRVPLANADQLLQLGKFASSPCRAAEQTRLTDSP